MSAQAGETVQVVEADTIVVQKLAVVCPHCGEEQGGWLADPRGGEHACDDCGKAYRVGDTPSYRFF
jgi:transposase-like protein